MVEHFLAVAFPQRRLLASVLEEGGAVRCLVEPIDACGRVADESAMAEGAIAMCGGVVAEQSEGDILGLGLLDELEDESLSGGMDQEGFAGSPALEVRWVPSAGLDTLTTH